MGYSYDQTGKYVAIVPESRAEARSMRGRDREREIKWEKKNIIAHFASSSVAVNLFD